MVMFGPRKVLANANLLKVWTGDSRMSQLPSGRALYSHSET